MMKRLSVLSALSLLSTCLGCSQINDVNGSFEESAESGRIQIQLDNASTRRFFRFHLRQFDDAVGGTFETFDLSNYEMFQQVPLYMSNAVNFYYCARIDYGYVRNNTAHIIFTDREQRQWLFYAPLGEDFLAGSLSRMHFNSEFNMNSQDLTEFLPEDAAYLSSGQDTNKQIVFQEMTKDTDKSLECLYYYKTQKLNFHIPDALSLESCQPSASQCNTLKLGIIGMPPQHSYNPIETTFFHNIMNAHLDSQDISESRLRTILLRDKPQLSVNTSLQDIFIATAIIYRDENQNDIWDKDSEPILASLNHQLLMFSDTDLNTALYGHSSSGETYEVPVLNTNNTPKDTGWHVYSYESDSTNTPYHAIKSLNLDNTTTLALQPIHLESDASYQGCYLTPNSDAQTSCTGIIPILFE